MLQCVVHDVILLFNELVVYAHYTRFVLIVNGCAMAQALVTRALTHCQRGCTLLGMASMASRPDNQAAPRLPHRAHVSATSIILFSMVWLAGWLAGWQGCAVVDRVWVGLLLKQ